jgi:hypothetical protein
LGTKRFASELWDFSARPTLRSLIGRARMAASSVTFDLVSIAKTAPTFTDEPIWPELDAGVAYFGSLKCDVSSAERPVD